MTKVFNNAINAARPENKTQRTIPHGYDMTGEDFMELVRLARSGNVFEAISQAFCFGFVMGNRATVSRNMKRL